MRAARVLAVWFWLPVVAVLAIPGAGFQATAEGPGLMLLKAMALELRSATISYRSRADEQSPAPRALNRVKRFAYLYPGGRGASRHVPASARLVLQARSTFPPLRRRFILTPRSPPAGESLATDEAAA